MIKDLVSIIIPSFNNCVFLQQMIESVICQSYLNWELIIVDDQSTDSTIELLSSYIRKDNRIKYYARDKETKGAQVCRNIGFEKSEGEYICFFDSDDLIAPFCLQQRIEVMKNNPEIGFAIFPAIAFNEKPFDRTDVAYGLETSNVIRDFIGRRLPFVVWNNIYRRDIILEKQLIWDEKIMSLQDSDYNIQAILKNIPYKFINNNADYFYRVGNNTSSISKKIISDKHIESHCYFFNKLIDTIPDKTKIKYKDEIINYILFFWNISINSQKYELINSICSNRWVQGNYWLCKRLLFLKSLLPISKFQTIYSKLYYLFFPISTIEAKIRTKIWRYKQGIFCKYNNENRK